MAQRTRLKTPFIYLEHHHIANRIFFRALWKKFDLKKRRIYQKLWTFFYWSTCIINGKYMTFFVFLILQKMWKWRFRVFIWWSPYDIGLVWSKTRREKSLSQKRMLVWIRRKERRKWSRSQRSLQRRRLWKESQEVQNVWRSQYDALRVYHRGVCC